MCSRAEEGTVPLRTDQPDEERLRQAARFIREERYEEAVCLLEPLARSGMPQAQVLLGWTFETGRGQRRDEEAAERWYREGAEAGYPVSEFYLGALHQARGEWSAARSLFLRSASKQFAPAYYRLALDQLRDPGDRAEALRLLNLARDLGHIPSAMKLDHLALRGDAGIGAKIRALVDLVANAARVMIIGAKQLNDERLVR